MPLWTGCVPALSGSDSRWPLVPELQRHFARPGQSPAIPRRAESLRDSRHPRVAWSRSRIPRRWNWIQMPTSCLSVTCFLARFSHSHYLEAIRRIRPCGQGSLRLLPAMRTAAVGCGGHSIRYRPRLVAAMGSYGTKTKLQDVPPDAARNCLGGVRRIVSAGTASRAREGFGSFTPEVNKSSGHLTLQTIAACTFARLQTFLIGKRRAQRSRDDWRESKEPGFGQVSGLRPKPPVAMRSDVLGAPR